MSTVKSDTLSTLSGAYSVPTETLARASCKAWVNFNGTGTVAIRRAFNVSSITDNGTGDYTVNFTNAMVDASYAYEFSGGGAVSSGTMVYQGSTQTTSNLRYTLASTTAAQDASTQCVAIFS